MTTLTKEEMRDSCLEATHAMLQSNTLIEIGQEAFTAPENEHCYLLLGILQEKVKIVLEFLQAIDLIWMEDRRLELLEQFNKATLTLDSILHIMEKALSSADTADILKMVHILQENIDLIKKLFNKCSMLVSIDREE